MITIRNPLLCQSITVIASATLVVGQLVKLIEGTAAGEPPQVAAASDADYKDATIRKGVLYFVPDNDEAVDFVVDPNDNSLTVNTDADNTYAIAEGDHCTFWFDSPIIAYHSSSFTSASGTTIAVTTREGAKVAFNTEDDLLDIYDSGDSDGSDTYQGTVIANDGAELTVLLSSL